MKNETKQRCESARPDGRRCQLTTGHKPRTPPDGHAYDGITGQNCTCMLRWYPNRCTAHPECNQ